MELTQDAAAKELNRQVCELKSECEIWHDLILEPLVRNHSGDFDKTYEDPVNRSAMAAMEKFEKSLSFGLSRAGYETALIITLEQWNKDPLSKTYLTHLVTKILGTYLINKGQLIH